MDAGTKSSVAPTPLNALNGSRWQRIRLGEPSLGEGTDLLATFDAILNQVTVAQPPVQPQSKNSRDDSAQEPQATNAVAGSDDEEQEQTVTQPAAAIVDPQPVIVVANADAAAKPAAESLESEVELTTASSLPQEKTLESAAATQQQEPRLQQQQTKKISSDSETVLANHEQPLQAQTTTPLAADSQQSTRRIKRESDRDREPLEANVADDDTPVVSDSSVVDEAGEGLRTGQADDNEGALTPRGSESTDDSTADRRRRRNGNSVREQREVAANQNPDPARSRNAVPQAVLEQLTPVDPYQLAGAAIEPNAGDSLQLTNAAVASGANTASQAIVQPSLLRSGDAAASSAAEIKVGETKGVGAFATAGRNEGIDAEAAVAGKRGSAVDGSTSSLRNEDRIRLIQRVSRAFQKLGNGGGQLHMMLHPSHLGSVRLDLDVQGRTMHATMTTQSENAAEVLKENIDDLRHRLEDFGIRVERMEIRVQESSSADRSQWQGGDNQRGMTESWSEQQSSGQRERGRDLERSRLHEGDGRSGQSGAVPATVGSRNRTASGLDLLL